MNKNIHTLFGLLCILMIGCNTPKEYKYLEQDDVTDCSEIDENLLKEALYSFENDIETHFNYGKYPEGSEISLQYAYSNFAYTGARGEADYNSMSSEHSMKIYNWLTTETELYTAKNDTLTLNYSHPFVTCVVANIKNKDIKNTIENLTAANTMSSEIIASPLRRNYIDAMKDKNFAMYMALDTYYKYLGLESKAMTRPPAGNHRSHDH